MDLFEISIYIRAKVVQITTEFGHAFNITFGGSGMGSEVAAIADW